MIAVSSCWVRAHAAAGFVVGCRVAASIGGLMGLLGWYWEGPVGILNVVVSLISVVSGVSIFICVVGVGGMVGSSLASSAASAVDCVVCCVSWGWEAMTGGLPIVVFAIFSEFAVIGVFMDIVGGSIWGSSLTSSVASVVNCDIDGARGLEAMAGRSRIVALPVFSV